MKIMVNKGEFKDLIQREWVISNGIGGFAASTVTGANTRKYHGLLVAALTPPARRFLVLSKVDESIEFNGCKYPLYTNICDNYISDGYKRIESFEKKYVPTYTYKIDDISIQKTISMQYGRNTVVVLYNIKNGNYNSKLTLAPIINYRDFHQVNKDTEFNLRENINGTKVRIVIKNESQTPFYMKCSEGTYIEHHNDIFYRMFYMEEEKRGFDPIENHAIPGRYEIELKPNEEKNISFVFSLEENIDEIKAEDIIKKEEDRLKKIVTDTGLINENTEDKELIEDFIITADSFIAYRPSFGLHTIIAGYPWFLDWGRDSLIAFEGLLLKTKRFDIAKEVLLTFIRDIKYGLVPNGYSGYDNRPLYNSADASLLLFEDIKKAPQPFMYMAFNMSSHEPFEVPMETRITGSSEEKRFLNAIYYSDACIGDFIRKCKVSGLWDNTLFILVADHGTIKIGDLQPFEPKAFHIPLLFAGGALNVQDTVISTIGSQSDIAATLLAQLGMDASGYRYSKNLLAEDIIPFAFYSYSNAMGIVSQEGISIYDLKNNTYLRGDSLTLNNERLKAYLQVLDEDVN